MTHLTLDASVIRKWYLDPSVEADVEAAQAIAIALRAGQIAVVQPPHWLAEVAAVTARMLPNDAATIVDELAKLNLEAMAGTALYQRAVRLALEPARTFLIRFIMLSRWTILNARLSPRISATSKPRADLGK